MNIYRRIKKTIPAGITVFIISVFYFFILKLNFPFPCLDTFDAIFDFANKFFSTNSFLERITLLFSQHNEHRMIFSRGLTVLSIVLTGKIQLQYLTFIGNICLVGLFILFNLSVYKIRNKTLLIPVIVALLLFQPQAWEVFVQAEAALSYFTVIFFVFLAIFLLAKKGRLAFILSLFSGAIATFASGNGMFVFLAGTVLLLDERRWKRLVFWAIFGSICVAVYLLGYKKPEYHPSILFAVIHPLKTAIYYFCFLGSSPFSLFFKGAEFNLFLSFIIGVLFSAFFLYLIVIKYFRRNIILFSLLFYVFFTALSIAIGRAGFSL